MSIEDKSIDKYVVKGSFDKWYEENIRKKLEQQLRDNPDPYASAIFKPADKPRMRVVDWKKAVKL